MSDFLKTNWSMIGRAARDQRRGDASALEELCQCYWRPVFSFFCRSGVSRDDAEDLTQAFFTRFVEADLAAKADPTRGRFRNFLLASARNFLADERDRLSARKRTPSGGFARLDDEVSSASSELFALASGAPSPQEAFEASFARDVVERTITKLLQEQAARVGERQALKYARLEAELQFLLDDPPPDYGEVAASLETTPAALKMSVSRLRKRFREELAAELASRNQACSPIWKSDLDADALDEDVRYVLTRYRFA